MEQRPSAGRTSRVRSVSLQPELDDFVRMLVDSGEFANYSEVVRTALRGMRREESERRARLELNPSIRKSIEQAKKGQTRDFDLRKIASEE